MLQRVIPIHPAAPPVPRVEPRLEGRPDALDRVLRGLRAVTDGDAGASIVELRWIRALSVDADEADLVLTVPPGTARGRQLAERSFDVLRRLLPDTDIYVRHA